MTKLQTVRAVVLAALATHRVVTANVSRFGAMRVVGGDRTTAMLEGGSRVGWRQLDRVTVRASV